MTWRGKRFRIPANEFAIPRMEAGKQRPIQSMEEARDWERLFIGEIKVGRDPRYARNREIKVGAQLNDVAAFLDGYFERCVKPAGLRSVHTVKSQISVLKKYLGSQPVSAIEEPDEINRFKADYGEDVEIASVHRVLERLRAAINWAMAQTPPLLAKFPFHRFGVRMNKKAETSRGRRVSREEEKRLLDTALREMNTPQHMYVGEMLHDRIIGALELCCRRGEMLLIQNKRVNWDTCQIGIPGATAKDKENRRIPFNPKGRVAAILKRRAALGPEAYVFGSSNGTYQPTIQTAWETLKLLANGLKPRAGKEGLEWNREQLQRPAVWDMREGALVAALLVGGGISPILFQWFRKRRFIITEGRWLSAAALGAGFGCAAVVLACALTPGVMGLGALAADSPSAARAARAAVAPISILVSTPAGLGVAPYFLIVGLPIVLPGGAFNSLVCLTVLRRHHRRRATGSSV